MSTIDLTLRINADGTVDAVGKLGAVSNAVKGTGDAAQKSSKGFAEFSMAAIRTIDSVARLSKEAYRLGKEIYGLLTENLTITNTAFRELDDVVSTGMINTFAEAIVKNDVLAAAVDSIAKSISAAIPSLQSMDDAVSSMTIRLLDAASVTMKVVAGMTMIAAVKLGGGAMKGMFSDIIAFEAQVIAALDKSLKAAEHTSNGHKAYSNKVILNKKAQEEANKALIKSEKELSDAILNGVDVAVTETFKELAYQEKLAQQTEDGIRDIAASRQDAAIAFDKQQQQASKLRGQEEKEVGRLTQAQEFYASMVTTAVSATVSAIQVAMESVRTGTATIGEAIGTLMLSVAQSIFSAMMSASLSSAVQAAIAGAGSVASIPYVGAFLAIGMVGTLLTTFLAVRSKMKAPSKEYGGLTGTGLMENMPVIVNSKERILNEREAREYEASKSQGSSQGRALVINTSVPQGVSNRLETQRYLRDVWVPELKRMKATGQLKWLTA